MKIFAPSEIVGKMPGITARQITDLAEKGIIDPFKQTTGGGNPRMYSEENVFQIMVALSLRGSFPIEILKIVMTQISEYQKQEINDGVQFDWLVMQTNGENIYFTPLTLEGGSLPMLEKYNSLETKSPKDFIIKIVNIRKIKNFIANAF